MTIPKDVFVRYFTRKLPTLGSSKPHWLCHPENARHFSSGFTSYHQISEGTSVWYNMSKCKSKFVKLVLWRQLLWITKQVRHLHSYISVSSVGLTEHSEIKSWGNTSKISLWKQYKSPREIVNGIPTNIPIDRLKAGLKM